MALYGSSPDIPKFAAWAQIVFTDVTGVIVGGSIPIQVEDRVTLVGTPNPFAHQRLMQAISNIVPDAGHVPLVVDGDEPIGPSGCASGACGVD